MINYNPKSWARLVFNFHRSSLMRNLLPTLLLTGAISGGLCYLFLEDVLHLSIPQGVNIHAYVGIVLGLVLVFRTNTAYDRWWEGRKQFGALTNHSRNLALKMNAVLPKDDHEARRYFSKSISNFYFALKEHLRSGVDLEELDLEDMPYKERVKQVDHIPNAIAGSMQDRLNKMLHERLIDGDQYRVINENISALVDILGACERIRKTPIPFSYSMYVKKVIILYLLSLPFSIINSLGYWTIPMVMFTGYVLTGLELIGEEIEDPFGHDANDLDTDGMAKNIRKNIREILIG